MPRPKGVAETKDGISPILAAPVLAMAPNEGFFDLGIGELPRDACHGRYECGDA
jgi:hypothetical protein